MDRDIFLPVSPFGYVRTLRTDDVSQSYADALSDKELTEFMVTKGRVFTIGDLVAYIQQNLDDPHALLLGIFDQDDRLVGTSRIHDISGGEPFCWMGIFIFHREMMGKGLGTHVVRTVSDYAMQVLGLKSVRASILTINEASRSCFRKAGFSLAEGGLEYQGLSREIWERRQADV